MTVATVLERQMQTLVNAARLEAGQPPLTLEVHLLAAADAHSAWMLAEDVFSHTGVAGSSAGERMEAAGFDFSGSWSWGENIAWQSARGAPGLADDVADLHEALMNSPGHRANILSGNFEHLGIGVATGDYEVFEAVMVTQTFARTLGQVRLDTPAAPLDAGEVAVVARLYEAGLDRNGEIDLAGLNFWVDAREDGLDVRDLAAAFLASPEFEAASGDPLDPSDPTYLDDEAFVRALYENVLDRAADRPGLDHWRGVLDLPDVDRPDLLLAFADSPENRAGTPHVDTLADAGDGFWFFA